MIIESEMTPKRQARYDVELRTLSERGEKIAALLFSAYHDESDGSEHSPLTVSQATTLLQDREVRATLLDLLGAHK